MIEKTVIIKNTLGLHARPAALFVKTTARFNCDVYVSRDDIRVSGKSIMGIMMLAAEQGSEITIETDGEDAADCMEALTRLVTSDFEDD